MLETAVVRRPAVWKIKTPPFVNPVPSRVTVPVMSSPLVELQTPGVTVVAPKPAPITLNGLEEASR